MTSVQAELSSTRLFDEQHTVPHMQDSHLHGASSLFSLPEILKRLGGRFAADIADILENPPEIPDTQHINPNSNLVDSKTYEHQQFALARLRSKNVQGAVDFIQRHAPEQMNWLRSQIKRFAPYALKHIQKTGASTKAEPIFPNISIVPDGILIDAEAGRIARMLGQFAVFRTWAFAHSIDDGDGWIERKELEKLWLKVEVAKSKRHARRIIQQGISKGYWTQDKSTKRIYLTGQVKVAVQLVEKALADGYHHLIETNKPGKSRVQVNLSGTLQEASAHLYAAWLVTKDSERKGTTISREMLCKLWQVSIPTLLSWEAIAGIGKQANYAQQNDTSLDEVPTHAYLTLNRDGTYAAAWRLPNTYFVKDKSIQQHSRTGKARKVRQAIGVEIALAEQRGSLGDAALPRSAKLYFTDDASHKIDPFRACSDYLRKLSRNDGDVFQRRYFYVGYRHGVRIYEPYDIVSNTPDTNIQQRLIWQESRADFVAARSNHRRILEDHHQYMALLA